MSASALADIIVGSEAIGRMNDQEFSEYWTALGKVVRIACRANPEPPAAKPETAPQEINNTSASTERSWTPTAQAPAAPFGFGQ
jgi:hypothetical protein